MTRLAVLADIHGKDGALAAVLVDVLDQSPDALFTLGDCFPAPWMPRARHIFWLDQISRPPCAATMTAGYQTSTPWTREIGTHIPTSAPKTLAWLASLPATAVIDDALLCNATPRRKMI